MSPKNISITLLALLATVLPVIAISNENTLTNISYTIINSTCASTLYPDLCIASLTSSSRSATSNITTTIDVVMLSLNHTISTINYNKIIINKIAVNQSLTAREKAALQDCNNTADDSLYELQTVKLNLRNYHSKNSSTDDLLMTLLSAVMTNQETCIDGFSHDEDVLITRSGFIAKQMHAYRLCSNVLAMVKNMTGRSEEDEDEDEIDSNNNAEHESSKWASAGHRKLLRSITVTLDAIVAADDTGNYGAVMEGVAAPASGGNMK